MPGINIRRGGGRGGGPPTQGTLLDKWNHWLSNGGAPGELDALISQARAISPGFARMLEGRTASRMGVHRWDLMGGGAASTPGFASMFAGIRGPVGGGSTVDTSLLSQILETERKSEKVLEKLTSETVMLGKLGRHAKWMGEKPGPAPKWMWTSGMGGSVPSVVARPTTENPWQPPRPPPPPGGGGGGSGGGGPGWRPGRPPFRRGMGTGLVGGSPGHWGALAAGGLGWLAGGVAGEIIAVVGEEAAHSAVAAVEAAQPWNRYHIQLARLGISEGLGLGPITGAFHPGRGRAPQAFRALNLTEQDARAMAAQFPLLAQDPAALAAALQAGNQLMPGFSRMPLSAVMGAAGQAGTLGLLGRNPAETPQKTFNYLDKLSRIMEAAGKTGIDQFKVLQSIQDILQRNAQAGGLPTTPSALWKTISPSFNSGLPGGASGAFASQVLGGAASRFSQTNQSAFQTFLTGQLSVSISPKQLAGILGPKAMANPAVQRVFQAYVEERNKLGPRNPLTLSIFSQLAAASAQSGNLTLTKMLGGQVAGMLPGGAASPANQLLGLTYATNSGMLATSSFMGAGIVPGSQAPSTTYGAQVLGMVSPGTLWPSGPHSVLNPKIVRGLAAEGVDTSNTTLLNAIVSAANATGMSPLAIGAVLNRESSGGRNPRAASNIMQLTAPAMADLRKAGLTTLSSPPSNIAQNILLGTEYLKMRGSFAAYNGGGTPGYGAAATSALQAGMTAAGMPGVAPTQVGYAPLSETSAGPDLGALSLQWSSMISVAQGPLIGFGGELERATTAVAHFVSSLQGHGAVPAYNPTIGGGSPAVPAHQAR